MARLKESCVQLMRLHKVQGLSYAEIGMQLKRSEGALRFQMHECLEEAREILRRLSAPPNRGSTAQVRNRCSMTDWQCWSPIFSMGG